MTNWIYSRLSRVTSTGRFIPEIDGLRFIAIALVVFVHIHDYISFRTGFPLDANHNVVNAQLNPLLYVVSHGGVGVQLFFVLSGFVLGLPFASHAFRGKPPVKMGPYFMRRLTRLEPPYIAALILSFFMVYVFTRNADARAELPESVAASLFYLHNVIFLEPPKVNVVFWSLEIEVQFYLLAPLLANVFKVPGLVPRRLLLIVMIIGIGFAQRYLANLGRLDFTIAAHLHYFLAGFLLADIYVDSWKEAPLPARWSLPVTIAGWPILFVLSDHRLELWKQLCLPILIVALYAAVLCRSTGTRWLSNRAVTTVGGMCYSIYLLHMIVIFSVGRLTQHVGPVGPYTTTLLVHAIPMLLAIALVSGVFFILVERPCMNRRWPVLALQRIAQFGKRRSPDVAAADASSDQ